MRFLTYFNLIVCLLFFTFSCSITPNSEMGIHDEVEWNYLIYMAADNNLERFAINNIKELQSVGTNENTNIIVLLDRSPSYDRSEGNWSGTKLILIKGGSSSINDDVVIDYEELDMTDKENLYNFLATVNNYFPARHTALNIWSHGRGVYPDGQILKSVIEDYTTGYGALNTMAIKDLAEVLERYTKESDKKIDIIQFDACNMQMIEIAWELKTLTDYIFASETEIPGNGSDYKKIAEYLKDNRNFTSREFSVFLSKSFYEYQKNNSINLSGCTIKTDMLNNFIKELDLICEELLSLSDEDLEQLLNIRKNLTQIDKGFVEYCDLFQFLNSLNEIGINTNAVIQKFLECIIDFYSTKDFTDKTYGISVNIPYSNKEFNYYNNPNSKYDILNFYKDTKFDDFLIRLNSVSDN